MIATLAISEEEWQAFFRGTTLRRVKTGTDLVRAGDLVQSAFFCIEGLFRLYYTLPDGREYNKSFVGEREFFTSYGALITQRPSFFSIQALEDALVLEIPYPFLQELMNAHHKWERFVRQGVEALYLKKEERERQLLYASARQRYDHFIRQYPSLAGRLPQYQIAAYLGISPVSLSRLLRSQKS
ncbi:Crp/Fnr family transcriptional regulator [Paenibacillus athensensis]|nr:Crp/Fnr family transcriptional regulator [Paenibacillus athensensis]